MWLLVCVLFGLVEGLLGRRGLVVLLLMLFQVGVIAALMEGLLGRRGLVALFSDVAPSVFTFWFGERGEGSLPCFLMWILVCIVWVWWKACWEGNGRLPCFLMWLIMCPFWFGGMLAGDKRVGCLALLQKNLKNIMHGRVKMYVMR